MKHQNFKDLILFENDNYILINKPPYVSSLDDRDRTRSSVLQMARDYWEDAQLCHRLDKETSGVIAIAKNPEAYRNLAMQFEHRDVDKVYHAIVGGIHRFEERVVEVPIAVSAKGEVRLDAVEGKPSLTVFNTLQVYKHHSLIECHPFTGRMHQIRIHLAYLKAPISADILYGGKFTYLSDLKRRFNLKKETEEEALMKRVALHARALHFTDIDGTPIQVEADYPKDFRAFLTQLEKNSR